MLVAIRDKKIAHKNVTVIFGRRHAQVTSHSVQVRVQVTVLRQINNAVHYLQQICLPAEADEGNNVVTISFCPCSFLYK